MMTFVVSIVNGGYASTVPGLQIEFQTSILLPLLGLTLFVLGFAVAPLALAPLLEVYGRSPIYLISFLVFWLFLLPQALAQNIWTVLIAKFITGCAGSTGSTMVGGTMSDLFHAEERGTYMALFTGLAFAGTFLGPTFSGAVAQSIGWRWTFWVHFIICGVYFLALCITLKETRGSVILSRRAKKMREDTGDDSYRTPTDDERESIAILIKVSLTRPLFLLFTEPIVACFSAWIALAWGIFYMLLESTSLIFGENHGFTEAQIGYTFAGPVVASILATAMTPVQDALYHRAQHRNKGQPVPEARLYTSMPGTILFTASLFWYGWTSSPSFHWILPVLAQSGAVFGIFTIYLATFSYLADSYKTYASSAIAAQSFARNVVGCIFPLFTRQMFEKLGYNWAGSLCGFLAMALSCVPFLLFGYGARIRNASPFAGTV